MCQKFSILNQTLPSKNQTLPSKNQHVPSTRAIKKSTCAIKIIFQLGYRCIYQLVGFLY
ncbi:hypothetical protein [Erinnyis ello granulovirus]|uniref:Uncharacterized protein n=1 Tax=Erinnyis ello granulovirus TaxID=307444 RepID=A0A097DAP1_9BBAC|nr:hypothetical protein [Erinnyis ello granulovirus]AIS92089.1 hypothetical protein [Erinnyis ello granulovirus]ARX71689.1 hypothetical protein EREL_090 [Erinnyis ello granulovirus]ARX71819.1 hypothetical protein EREL_090 [Erinnyis ello granulovirus]ARX71949.1 hypothetical protein EREL_090 [Erinnyis ello granulovirus]ARX72079.1 hypothetical protein EREL_090 [Erinnyis ello granulovirus]